MEGQVRIVPRTPMIFLVPEDLRQSVKHLPSFLVITFARI